LILVALTASPFHQISKTPFIPDTSNCLLIHASKSHTYPLVEGRLSILVAVAASAFHQVSKTPSNIPILSHLTWQNTLPTSPFCLILRGKTPFQHPSGITFHLWVKSIQLSPNHATKSHTYPLVEGRLSILVAVAASFWALRAANFLFSAFIAD